MADAKSLLALDEWRRRSRRIWCSASMRRSWIQARCFSSLRMQSVFMSSVSVATICWLISASLCDSSVCISSMLLRGVPLVLELTGIGSLADGYGEDDFGDVGDDERDWNSGELGAMGALKGISMAMRRWRASFWAERSIYFCIDSCWPHVSMSLDQVLRATYPTQSGP